MAPIAVDRHKDKAHKVVSDLKICGDENIICCINVGDFIKGRSQWEAYSVTIRW